MLGMLTGLVGYDRIKDMIWIILSAILGGILGIIGWFIFDYLNPKN